MRGFLAVVLTALALIGGVAAVGSFATTPVEAECDGCG
jgi:hypothetical protein